MMSKLQFVTKRSHVMKYRSLQTSSRWSMELTRFSHRKFSSRLSSLRSMTTTWMTIKFMIMMLIWQLSDAKLRLSLLYWRSRACYSRRILKLRNSRKRLKGATGIKTRIVSTSSLMAVGNAPAATITTLKVGKSARDARSRRLPWTRMAFLSTWR